MFGFSLFIQYQDQEARELWSQLQLKLPTLFQMVDNIQPALMHGDLWGGNVGENENGPGDTSKNFLIFLKSDF